MKKGDTVRVEFWDFWTTPPRKISDIGKIADICSDGCCVKVTRNNGYSNWCRSVELTVLTNEECHAAKLEKSGNNILESATAA